MSTPLGSSLAVGVQMNVVNKGSTLIPRFRLCSLDVLAASGAVTDPLVKKGSDLSTIEFVVPVVRFDGANMAGVTTSAIAPGDTGTIVVFGAVFVEVEGAVASRDPLEPLTTAGNEGKVQAVGAGGTDKVMGIAMSDDFAETTDLNFEQTPPQLVPAVVECWSVLNLNT